MPSPKSHWEGARRLTSTLPPVPFSRSSTRHDWLEFKLHGQTPSEPCRNVFDTDTFPAATTLIFTPFVVATAKESWAWPLIHDAPLDLLDFA